MERSPAGVYFAKDSNTSLSYMAHSSGARWKSATISVSGCMALAEIVNLPKEFTSFNPYYVVKQTEWIVW